MRDWLLKYGLAAAFGALGAFVGRLAKKRRARLAEREARQTALEAGVRALLHDRLRDRCAACLRQGFAGVADRENLEGLYAPYHALGGNGTGTELYGKILKLPVEPEQKEES